MADQNNNNNNNNNGDDDDHVSSIVNRDSVESIGGMDNWKELENEIAAALDPDASDAASVELCAKLERFCQTSRISVESDLLKIASRVCDKELSLSSAEETMDALLGTLKTWTTADMDAVDGQQMLLQQALKDVKKYVERLNHDAAFMCLMQVHDALGAWPSVRPGQRVNNLIGGESFAGGDDKFLTLNMQVRPDESLVEFDKWRQMIVQHYRSQLSSNVGEIESQQMAETAALKKLCRLLNPSDVFAMFVKSRGERLESAFSSKLSQGPAQVLGEMELSITRYLKHDVTMISEMFVSVGTYLDLLHRLFISNLNTYASRVYTTYSKSDPSTIPALFEVFHRLHLALYIVTPPQFQGCLPDLNEMFSAFWSQHGRQITEILPAVGHQFAMDLIEEDFGASPYMGWPRVDVYVVPQDAAEGAPSSKRNRVVKNALWPFNGDETMGGLSRRVCMSAMKTMCWLHAIALVGSKQPAPGMVESLVGVVSSMVLMLVEKLSIASNSGNLKKKYLAAASLLWIYNHSTAIQDIVFEGGCYSNCDATASFCGEAGNAVAAAVRSILHEAEDLFASIILAPLTKYDWGSMRTVISVGRSEPLPCLIMWNFTLNSIVSHLSQCLPISYTRLIFGKLLALTLSRIIVYYIKVQPSRANLQQFKIDLNFVIQVASTYESFAAFDGGWTLDVSQDPTVQLPLNTSKHGIQYCCDVLRAILAIKAGPVGPIVSFLTATAKNPYAAGEEDRIPKIVDELATKEANGREENNADNDSNENDTINNMLLAYDLHQDFNPLKEFRKVGRATIGVSTLVPALNMIRTPALGCPQFILHLVNGHTHLKENDYPPLTPEQETERDALEDAIAEYKVTLD